MPDPDVDVVIIGLNSSRTLKKCIRSLLCDSNVKFTQHIFYVDGGSSDDSLNIAKKFPEVTAFENDSTFPSPGGQRNAGWKLGKAEFVMFVDSDTTVEKHWIKIALKTFAEASIAAVCGKRVELFPNRSFYNWIANLEWNQGFGEVEAFGGDVIIRREILESINGYDNDLIAGEDPELSFRIRKSGYKIYRLNEIMTRHDLNMTSFSQYLKRSYRTGYGFAEINYHYKTMWRRENQRILLRGGLVFLLLSLSVPMLLVDYRLSIIAFGLSLILMFKPSIFSVGHLQNHLKISRRDAFKYSLHASIVVIPQLFGVIRYYLGLILKMPNRNKR